MIEKVAKEQDKTWTKASMSAARSAISWDESSAREPPKLQVLGL